jgi:hypothetical protein
MRLLDQRGCTFISNWKVSYKQICAVYFVKILRRPKIINVYQIIEQLKLNSLSL